jgi:hypothetical protein
MQPEAYKLQGLDGWVRIADGQSFTGRSRGFQVLLDGTFTATNLTPKNTTSSIPGDALVQGMYVGGVILTLAVAGGGAALVYPMNSEYTVA